LDEFESSAERHLAELAHASSWIETGLDRASQLSAPFVTAEHGRRALSPQRPLQRTSTHIPVSGESNSIRKLPARALSLAPAVTEATASAAHVAVNHLARLPASESRTCVLSPAEQVSVDINSAAVAAEALAQVRYQLAARVAFRLSTHAL